MLAGKLKKTAFLLLTGCMLISMKAPVHAAAVDNPGQNALDDSFLTAPLGLDQGITVTIASKDKYYVGENGMISADVAGGTISDCRWESSDSEVLTFTDAASGEFTAKKEGNVRLSFFYKEADDTAEKNVTSDVTVELGTIVAKKTSIYLGETTTVTYMQGDLAVTGVTWRSSDDTVLSVDENGLVTAKKVGTALISVLNEEGVELAAPVEIKVAVKPVSIEHSAHVQDIGWTGTSTSSIVGTTGRSLRMEAIKLKVKGVKNLGVSYSAHVQDVGWMKEVSNGAVGGSTGYSRRLEAITLRLTGAMAQYYDIYYRAHVANVGWLDWAKNGQQAGSAGYSYGIEALEIKVLEKNAGNAPTNTSKPFIEKVTITHQAHVSNVGWMAATETGTVLGTTGRSLSLEAVIFNSTNSAKLRVECNPHVQNIGWMGYQANGKIAGTTGRSLMLEGMKLRLAGSEANKYDIYYRAHVANVGWLDWAKNGEAAGSTGQTYGLEAVQIRIVQKGAAAPGSRTTPCLNEVDATYTAYVKNVGWTNKVTDGITAGTTGVAKTLEAFKVKVSGVDHLGISYSAHVSNVGWMNSVSDFTEAGMTKNGQQLEAVKIQLTGAASKYYDVYYRVHASNIGWLDWAKNGQIAGTSSLGYGSEAIQIVVQLKSKPAPGLTTTPHISSQAGWVYVDGYRRYRDAKGRLLDDVSSLFNPANKYITIDRTKGITTIYGYNSATGRYDTPIKAMLCSVGQDRSPTPAGTHSISWKMSVKEMNGKNYDGSSYRCWAPYVSEIVGAVYFHGVASNTPDLQSVSAGAFAALGTKQSHGCVRLAACDAKWIYYNCPVGTTVKVSDNIASPLGAARYPWVGGPLGPDPTY